MFWVNGSQHLKESRFLYLQGLSDSGRCFLDRLALEDTSITLLCKVWNHTAKECHTQEGLKASWLSTFDCCLAVPSQWLQD
jgi:hypothetical protein